MYLTFSKENNCYLVNQTFGYALSGVFQDLHKKNKLKLCKVNEEVETDVVEIHETLLNMMVFSSHYFEDSLYYKKYMEAYKGFFDSIRNTEEYLSMSDFKKRSKNYEEYKQYFDDLEKKAEEKCLVVAKELLLGAKIDKKEEYYKTEFFIQNKPLFYHKVERKLTVIENGKEVEFQLITLKLSSVFENGKFVHVEPASLYTEENLECPITPERKEENKKKIKEINSPNYTRKEKGICWTKGYYRIIEDAITLGIMSKFDPKEKTDENN